MRQNSKNNRSRGRGGRKGPNPLTRSYESNGPDVKVRGTAQHVAEKYMTLARDALSSGDSIAAENYFQHAEHYNRIIMTAQAQANSAREEERRLAAQAMENAEQPRQDDAMMTNGHAAPAAPAPVEQPSVPEDTGSDAEAAPSEPVRKPRTRRGPGRPRTRTASVPDGASPDAEAQPVPKPAPKPKSEESDTIADNPPAFLMSE